ncbi:hypothetical protein AEPCKKLL_01409 [Stenotrophomonas maltophilia]|nr:hypothetical protein AEPCKKLL_01409 [Stenotrophomonas maltophilia]
MTDFEAYAVIACGWILLCILIALVRAIERRQR